MTKEKFKEWFVANIDMMASMGIYHPDSDKGKVVRVMASLFYDKIEEVERRLKLLEESKNENI